MIFDFGPVAQFFEVTAQYSNAVLLAVLPHVADFNSKIGLRPAGEFTTHSVSRLAINPMVFHPKDGGVQSGIFFKNGYSFWFDFGRVSGFSTSSAYTREQDPDRVPTYYGKIRMTEAEAVAFGRRSLTNLGYRIESWFADLKPEVTLPEQVGTNVVAVYVLKWPAPEGGHAVTMEINASRRSLEALTFSGRRCIGPPLDIAVTPPRRDSHPFTGFHPRGINPDYGHRLLPIVIEAVKNYAALLSIALPQALTTHHIHRFTVGDNGGWPHAELFLTNGAMFVFRGTRVAGYYAPDQFWDDRYRKLSATPPARPWRMSDKEMVELARKTLARLPLPEGLLRTQGRPELRKPGGEFAQRIPHCQITWMYPSPENMTQWSFVEIDADQKSVKAIYFDDQSFWGNAPAIQVPITSMSGQ